MTTIQQLPIRSSRRLRTSDRNEHRFAGVNLGDKHRFSERNIARTVHHALQRYSELHTNDLVVSSGLDEESTPRPKDIEELRLAQNEPVGSLSDVHDFVDHISFDASDVSSEMRLNRSIREAIHHSSSLSDCDIDVTVTGTEVVLSGTVRLSLQKRLAAEIVRRFSARSVRNDIRINRQGEVI